MGSVSEIDVSGNLLIALPIALAAGLVSFASPCVLPLVPGYLGYVGGFAGTGEKADRRRLLLGDRLGRLAEAAHPRRQHRRWALLILVGLLMVTGLWTLFIANLGSVINGFVPAI